MKNSQGQNSIPKSFYQNVTLPSSAHKKYKNIFFNQTDQKIKKESLKSENEENISFRKPKNPAPTNGKYLLYKSKTLKKIIGLNNPEKKVRNVLYERISDKNFLKCFTEFKHTILMKDFEKVIDDDSILEDTTKRNKFFQDLISNYQFFDDKEKYIETICKTNDLTLSNLLEIDEGLIYYLAQIKRLNRKNSGFTKFFKK